MSTTDTWKKLAQPEKTAGEMVKEIAWTEVTEGTEKQIKFANDLRNEWISDVTHPANMANVKYAVVQQTQNGLDLASFSIRSSNRREYFDLSHDAENRRAIRILNTNNAKAIIDYFKDTKSQQARIDNVNKYDGVIRYPEKYQHDGKRWNRK